MADGIRPLLAFLLAALLTTVTVPAAISVARRTGFFDAPAGYKVHKRPTPYLGGAAVLAAALPAILIFGHGGSRWWPILVGAVGLAVVGTIDDRIGLSPWTRVATELAAALLLWATDLGWTFLDGDLANLLLTALWVVGVVNAFNLMDNLDGAAASVALVSAACVLALALIGESVYVAVIAAGLCGALAGFLRFNLDRPARIFLGDGGSMAIGFLVAGSLTVAPLGELSGWSTLVAAVLVVGVPVFDTALVVLSRRRRGAPILSGATDHTTHRLNAAFNSPRTVACVLVVAQSALCLLAVEVTRLGRGAAFVALCFILVLGAATIAVMDRPRWQPAPEDS